jgi:hypothetical protein
MTLGHRDALPPVKRYDQEFREECIRASHSAGTSSARSWALSRKFSEYFTQPPTDLRAVQTRH